VCKHPEFCQFWLMWLCCQILWVIKLLSHFTSTSLCGGAWKWYEGCRFSIVKHENLYVPAWKISKPYLSGVITSPYQIRWTSFHRLCCHVLVVWHSIVAFFSSPVFSSSLQVTFLVRFARFTCYLLFVVVCFWLMIIVSHDM